MTGRRGFLRRLGAAALGLALSRTLPGIVPTPPVVTEPRLYIRADAFKQIGELLSMRYEAGSHPPRFDVLYGWGVLKDQPVRIEPS